MKAEKEEKGECVVCYGEQEHLQVRCQNCGTMRVLYLHRRDLSIHQLLSRVQIPGGSFRETRQLKG